MSEEKKCLRCGKTLKRIDSITRRYGKTCWRKVQMEKSLNTKNAEEAFT